MKVGQLVIETTNETEWDKYFVRRIMKVKMMTGIKVIKLFYQYCINIKSYYFVFSI